tara:strand:+ start:1834 stop:2925 length:1092 start_codon:yes stop_codon:yes gene_type:complete
MLDIFKRNYLVSVIIGILFIWITGAIIISVIEPGSFSNFKNSLWWTIVTMTTVGYGDMAPTTELGRFLAVIIMLFGICLIAVVTGTISSNFTTKKIMEGKGLGNITSTNHTLICGWNNNINHLIESLIESNKNIDIVLICNETEDTVNNILSIYTNVKFIKGDFTLDSTLNNANAKEAKNVILLNNNELINDEKIILATLSLKKIAPKIKIIAQLNDKEKIAFLKRANVDIVLTNHSFESFMTTFHITNPSVAHTLEELIDKDSKNNLRNREIPSEFIGKKFSDLFQYFYDEKNEICIGTYYQEENISISEFLSSDASALDKFIEDKLKNYGHSFEEKNKLNINLNPKKEDIINKGQGALVLK